ncbi:MAG: hypothetical protein AB1401_10225 [Thermodesulfobacteriota bacterium]
MIEIEPNFQKRNEFKGDDLVCYCFNYTKRDIENDFVTNNRSLIYEKISSEKKAGRCNCAEENPKGK